MKLLEFYNLSEHTPPENIDVLAYTEQKKFMVVRLLKGRFNTYIPIIKWAYLPEMKEDEIVQDQEQECAKEEIKPKRRGRPKKNAN